MPARKIAYLTPFYFDEASSLGGGERYPWNLARGVVASSGGEYEVEIISYGESSGRRELGPGISLRILEAAFEPPHPIDVASWELPDALADADLVHIHAAYTRSAELGILIAKHQRKPICVTDHGGYASSLGDALGSLDLADRVLCYSDFGASFYKTTTPIEIVKGGVDTEAFAPPAGPRPDRDRVLFVGRLLPHKGIDVLIRALPAELPLTVCGRPYFRPYYDYLRELAAGKRIEFVTDADDATIRDLYGRAWANVLPSVYKDCYGNAYQAPELMGFTLLEAMACETPAIASRVGAMPEFVRQGETGFLYDDPGELAGYLRLLAGDPAEVERIGEHARRVVVEDYGLEVAGARFLAVYRDLIGRARAREEAA